MACFSINLMNQTNTLCSLIGRRHSFNLLVKLRDKGVATHLTK